MSQPVHRFPRYTQSAVFSVRKEVKKGSISEVVFYATQQVTTNLAAWNNLHFSFYLTLFHGSKNQSEKSSAGSSLDSLTRFQPTVLRASLISGAWAPFPRPRGTHRTLLWGVGLRSLLPCCLSAGATPRPQGAPLFPATRCLHRCSHSVAGRCLRASRGISLPPSRFMCCNIIEGVTRDVFPKLPPVLRAGILPGVTDLLGVIWEFCPPQYIHLPSFY